MRITPHGGGELVDLRCTDAERPALLERARGLKQLTLDARELSDLELLTIGGLSPLRGFLTEAECKTVVDDMHLPGGVPWTLPVTVSAERKLADSLASPLPGSTPRQVPGPVHLPGKATAVVGMRRAGKTTFLHQLRRERLEAGAAGSPRPTARSPASSGMPVRCCWGRPHWAPSPMATSGSAARPAIPGISRKVPQAPAPGRLRPPLQGSSALPSAPKHWAPSSVPATAAAQRA